jgi:chaperonin GroES
MQDYHELHCWLDLDGDGIDEPWIVTICCETQEVIAIYARWSKSGIIRGKSVVNATRKDGKKKNANTGKEYITFRPHQYFQPYTFLPDPEGGFHGLGYGWALERYERLTAQLMASAIDTVKNTSQDGGVMSGIGFGAPETVKLKGNTINILQAPDGRPLSEVYQPFIKHGLDQSVPTMIEMLLKLAAQVGGGINQLTEMPGDASATMAAGVIQGEAQAHSAIYRRMHTAMTNEIRNFVEFAADMGTIPAELATATKDSIALTADPVISTETIRTALVAYYQSFLEDPFTQPKELRMRMHKLMRVPDADKLFMQPQQNLSPEAQAKMFFEMTKLADKRNLDMSVSAKNYGAAALSAFQSQEDFTRLIMDMLAWRQQMIAGSADGSQQGNDPGMASPPGNPSVGGAPGGGPTSPGGQMGDGGGVPNGPGPGGGAPGPNGADGGPGSPVPGLQP